MFLSADMMQPWFELIQSDVQFRLEVAVTFEYDFFLQLGVLTLCFTFWSYQSTFILWLFFFLNLVNVRLPLLLSLCALYWFVLWSVTDFLIFIEHCELRFFLYSWSWTAWVVLEFEHLRFFSAFGFKGYQVPSTTQLVFHNFFSKSKIFCIWLSWYCVWSFDPLRSRFFRIFVFLFFENFNFCGWHYSHLLYWVC